MRGKKVKQPEEVKLNGHEEMSGAEALLRALIEEGTDTIFGYPGGAIMPVYDKLLDYEDKLNHILTRHEQGAAHAAQAYAMVTGKPGVCFATSGPGSPRARDRSPRRHRAPRAAARDPAAPGMGDPSPALPGIGRVRYPVRSGVENGPAHRRSASSTP